MKKRLSTKIGRSFSSNNTTIALKRTSSPLPLAIPEQFESELRSPRLSPKGGVLVKKLQLLGKSKRRYLQQFISLPYKVLEDQAPRSTALLSVDGNAALRSFL